MSAQRNYTHNVPDRNSARRLERVAQRMGALTCGPRRCADRTYDVFMVLRGDLTRDQVLKEYDKRHGRLVIATERGQ